MLKRRGSIFIGGKKYWKRVEGVFSGYQGPNKRENYRPRLWGPKGGKATVELFHREERPALERHTIDTSEWTRASHRHVMGKHFGLDIRAGSANLQLCAK